MKKFWKKWGFVLTALALTIGTTTVNSPSHYVFHQPEIPEGMKRFKK